MADGGCFCPPPPRTRLMEAARPNLSLVVNPDGEVVEQSLESVDTDAEVRVLYRKLQGTVKGWMLRCDALEKELERKQDKAPESKRVRSILEYWAEQAVSTGWWTRLPFFAPGHPRWKAVSARLKDIRPDGSHPYDEDYLAAVADGALSQPKTRTERQWVDADSIYKAGNLEKHYQRAIDPSGERVRTLAELPPEWRHVDTKELSRRCDCGHLHVFHSFSIPPYGFQPCRDCECMDFDDIGQRFAEAERRKSDPRADASESTKEPS